MLVAFKRKRKRPQAYYPLFMIQDFVKTLNRLDTKGQTRLKTKICVCDFVIMTSCIFKIIKLMNHGEYSFFNFESKIIGNTLCAIYQSLPLITMISQFYIITTMACERAWSILITTHII